MAGFFGEIGKRLGRECKEAQIRLTEKWRGGALCFPKEKRAFSNNKTTPVQPSKNSVAVHWAAERIEEEERTWESATGE